MKNKYLMLKLTLLCMFLVVSVTPTIADAAAAKEKKSSHKQCLTPSVIELKDNLRKLWIDHVVWTKNYIVSAFADSEDKDKVLARLLQNQQDIGDVFKPYYGEAVGDKLAQLLREHILIAGKVLGAVKAGIQADVEKYNKEWYANADDIAKFLSSQNPKYSYEQLKEMLHEHLELITDDVTARVKKDWDAEIAAFDKGLEHMIMFADILTEGLIKQFPDKFN
ncbi:glycosyltransferase [Paenibacillus odorifer]|uniref:glycosyltransferase n=1 Tax=Paenibacillus odorifer TaxID=189426 RepID=UPI0020C06D97|nr:glycosyltransferase [Paenibacillus odorifer]